LDFMWLACAATTTANSLERDSENGSARAGARAGVVVLVPVLVEVTVLAVVMEEATAMTAIAGLIVGTSCPGW